MIATNEELIPLDQASDEIAGRPHRQTIRRWMSTGINGVKLAHWRVGSRLFTTRGAIREFVERLTAADDQSKVEAGAA